MEKKDKKKEQAECQKHHGHILRSYMTSKKSQHNKKFNSKEYAESIFYSDDNFGNYRDDNFGNYNHEG